MFRNSTDNQTGKILVGSLLDPSSIVNMHYNEITRFVKHRKDALLMHLRDPQRNRTMHNVSQKSCSED